MGETLKMFLSLARAEEINQKSGSYIYIIKDNKLPYNKAILITPRMQSSNIRKQTISNIRKHEYVFIIIFIQVILSFHIISY